MTTFDPDKVNTESKPQELLNSIDELKKILIDRALTHGFTNPNTIEISQKLDILLNKLQNYL